MRWSPVDAMTEFLLGAAAFTLAMMALGIIRVLRGPRNVDRIMAAQLFGTGGIAAALLTGAATGVGATLDVALTLAMLAAFASFAFANEKLALAAADSQAADNQ